MKCKFILFATACLSCLLAPAAGASLYTATNGGNGLVIGGVAGASLISGGESVVIQSPPGHVVQTLPGHNQLVIQQNPVPLVPLATIPSHSFTDRVANLWGGISDSIGGKIRAVGDFFRPAPRVVVLNKPSKKPCLQSVLDVVAGIPQHRFLPILEDCA